jgi:hypothetical protein
MTCRLSILAVFAVGLGVLGTPAWPWFTSFLESKALAANMQAFGEPGLLPLMGFAILLVLSVLALDGGSMRASRSKPGDCSRITMCRNTATSRSIVVAEYDDVLEQSCTVIWKWLANRLYFDELYAATVLRWYAALAWLSDWLDRRVWGGVVSAVAKGFRGLGWMNKSVDSQWIDGAFDKGCEELVTGGGMLAWLQAGALRVSARAGRGSACARRAGARQWARQPGRCAMTPVLTILTAIPAVAALLALALRAIEPAWLARSWHVSRLVASLAFACALDMAGDWRTDGTMKFVERSRGFPALALNITSASMAWAR